MKPKLAGWRRGRGRPEHGDGRWGQRTRRRAIAGGIQRFCRKTPSRIAIQLFTKTPLDRDNNRDPTIYTKPPNISEWSICRAASPSRTELRPSSTSGIPCGIRLPPLLPAPIVARAGRWPVASRRAGAPGDRGLAPLFWHAGANPRLTVTSFLASLFSVKTWNLTCCSSVSIRLVVPPCEPGVPMYSISVHSQLVTIIVVD